MVLKIKSKFNQHYLGIFSLCRVGPGRSGSSDDKQFHAEAADTAGETDGEEDQEGVHDTWPVGQLVGQVQEARKEPEDCIAGFLFGKELIGGRI